MFFLSLKSDLIKLLYSLDPLQPSPCVRIRLNLTTLPSVKWKLGPLKKKLHFILLFLFLRQLSLYSILLCVSELGRLRSDLAQYRFTDFHQLYPIHMRNWIIINSGHQGFQPNFGIEFHDYSRNISVFPGYKYQINMNKNRL